MEQNNWDTIKYLNDVVNYTQDYGDTPEVVEVRAYGSDVLFVKEVLLENAKNQKGVLSRSEPLLRLDSFCEFSLDLDMYFSNNSFLHLEKKSELPFEVEERFRFHKIRISLPQRGIHNDDKSNLLIPTENE